MRFLGDYIFWDSVTINKWYSENHNFSARYIAGYGEEYQAVSSSLKLEEFELIRLLNGYNPRLASYLARDIRNGIKTTSLAKEILAKYEQRTWRLGGLAQFLEVPLSNINDLFTVLSKKSGVELNIDKSKNGLSVVSHGQLVL